LKIVLFRSGLFLQYVIDGAVINASK